MEKEDIGSQVEFTRGGGSEPMKMDDTRGYHARQLWGMKRVCFNNKNFIDAYLAYWDPLVVQIAG